MIKILLAAIISLSMITACGQNSTENPSPSPAHTDDSNMANDIKNTVDDIENGVGDAVNDAGDAVKDTGNAVKNMNNSK